MRHARRYGGLLSALLRGARFKIDPVTGLDDGKGEGGGAGGSGGAGGAGSGGGAGGSGGRTFSQDELNSVLSREKKAWKDQQEKMLVEVEELRKSKNLTDEQRAKLEIRSTELENALLTEQEKAAKELAKRERLYNEQLQAAAQERDNWRSRYTDSTIENEISAAATVEKAVSTRQIIALVKPLALLVEEKDKKQNPTGKFRAVIKAVVSGEEKELSIAEYVKLMKSEKESVNLFYSDRAGGTGYRPGTAGAGAGSTLSSSQKIAAGLRALPVNQGGE